MTDFATALAPLANACATDTADAQYAAASAVCGEVVGHDLCTLMRFEAQTWEVARLYSTRPDVYPPGGRKPKRSTPWGLQVLGEGVPFSGSGEDAIRWAFDDADTILQMGLSHVINMPIRARGKTLGTLNLLRGAPAFSDADAARLRVVAGMLAAGFVHAAKLPDHGAMSC